MVDQYSIKEFARKYFKENQIGERLLKQIPLSESSVFMINKMEHNVPAINIPKKGIKSNYYEVFLITKGHCTVEYNLQPIVQRPKQIRFSSPGSTSFVKEISEEVEGYYILFDEEFMRVANRENQLTHLPFFSKDTYPLIQLNTKTLKQFVTILEHLIKLLGKPKSHENDRIIATYLTAFLMECEELFDGESMSAVQNSSAQRITKSFLALLNKNSLRKMQISDYADELCISPKHLTKSIKSVTGFPPSHFVNKTMILEAKIQLMESQDTVSEIANYLGFSDVSYFVRFFKKHTTTTPSGFRKSGSS